MTSRPRPLTRERPASERIIEVLLFVAAALGVVTTIGIVLVLAFETLEFFREVNPIDFFTGTFWSASIQPRAWGVLAARLGNDPRGRHRDDHRGSARPALGGPAVGLRARHASEPSSSRSSRRSPASRRSCSGSSRSTSSPPAPDPAPGPGEHRGLLGAGRRDRGRAAGDAAHRLDLRGRHARRSARPARRGLRDGRDEVRSRPQGRLPSRDLGDHGVDHPGHEPGHRRDDGRRCWPSGRSRSSRSIRPRASRP